MVFVVLFCSAFQLFSQWSLMGSLLGSHWAISWPEESIGELNGNLKGQFLTMESNGDSVG